MSVDRYVSLQTPALYRRTISSKQAMLIITCMWVVSSLFMGPMLYIKDTDYVEIPYLSPLEFCVEHWPQERDRQAYGLFLMFVVFLIPAGTLTICYLNVGRTLCVGDLTREGSDSSTRGLFSRKRAARMLIILVIAFMVCWLPYNIASISSDLKSSQEAVLNILFFTLWLGHAHSAINPVMFWLLNRRFRQRIRFILKRIRTNGCVSLNNHPPPTYV